MQRRGGKRALTLALLLALAGCGGGDGSGSLPDQPVAVNTFAHVLTECSENPSGATARQALKIRQRNGETITVAEFPLLGPLPALGLCNLFGLAGEGASSVVALPFQRLGVSPDGSTVVFEVSDDHSIVNPFLPPEGIVPPEREGFFAVDADGGNLRKLGPASREASFRVDFDPTSPLGLLVGYSLQLGFSPDGRRVVFTDLGPGPDGQEAAQVFALELGTGVRKQLTQLPPLTPAAATDPAVQGPAFIDAEQVIFFVHSVEETAVVFTHSDGSGPIRSETSPVATGGRFLPRFSITPNASVAATFVVSGEPVHPYPGAAPSSVSEVFLIAGDNRLQLTRFGRIDTGSAGSFVNAEASRVLFSATADPFGLNPDEGCQFFSMDTLGSDLRQVTRFANGVHGSGICTTSPPAGCHLAFAGQDLEADSVLFSSNCSPFNVNSSNGGDVLTMRLDGTGLRQLVSTRGMSTDPDGTVHVQLPGPFAYPEVFR